MIKKGDTLIEVTLAVGIFSMIAIAIVAVMSNGVANAQTALEATLTREEIDAQAEALRFIHSSYIANINSSSETNSYRALWDAIIENAVELDDEKELQQATLQYSPSNCSEDLFNAKNLSDYFIINSRKLSNFENTGEVVVDYAANASVFQPATTYPRLVYGSSGDDVEKNIMDRKDSLFRAEGIYILAVKDKKTTTTGQEQKNMAFYDFYIRTCWYGNRSSDASTISTVIRLYDPAFVSNSSNP